LYFVEKAKNSILYTGYIWIMFISDKTQMANLLKSNGAKLWV